MSGKISDTQSISSELPRVFRLPHDMPAALADALAQIVQARCERMRVRCAAHREDDGEPPLVGTLESVGADPDNGHSWLVVSLDQGGRYVGEASGWKVV